MLPRTPGSCCNGIVGNNEATLEHMLPAAKGGNNTLYNLALTHAKCNSYRNERIQPFTVTHSFLGQGPVVRGIVDENKLKVLYGELEKSK